MNDRKLTLQLPGDRGMLIHLKLEDLINPKKMIQAYLNIKAHLEIDLPRSKNHVDSNY